MRASRLLQMLLLLQNRGRLTCAVLAHELEVTRRTVLRDVDAMTEAGLPIVVIRGNQGGIELGFNYRTRLTGLAADEAEALAVLLSQPASAIDELGMRESANRAIAKLVESLPDPVREKITTARKQFVFAASAPLDNDSRITAIAQAIRERRIIYLLANTAERRKIEPQSLKLEPEGWAVVDHTGQTTALTDCGDINISARHF
jgi:predicted DNA-binding transcriptional regulator YafY